MLRVLIDCVIESELDWHCSTCLLYREDHLLVDH